MSTKLREVIWGGRIMGAKIRAQGARERAQQAIRVADRAEAEAWSVRMEDYSGPAQPSPTIGQCINGGLAWLEVECARCKTRASLPLDAIRRPKDTPLWKLEASLKDTGGPRQPFVNASSVGGGASPACSAQTSLPERR